MDSFLIISLIILSIVVFIYFIFKLKMFLEERKEYREYVESFNIGFEKERKLLFSFFKRRKQFGIPVFKKFVTSEELTYSNENLRKAIELYTTYLKSRRKKLLVSKNEVIRTLDEPFLFDLPYILYKYFTSKTESKSDLRQ